MFGFCLNTRASWKVNSYLKPRLRFPLSWNLNLSETASSSSAGLLERINSSNSTEGVFIGKKP